MAGVTCRDGRIIVVSGAGFGTFSPGTGTRVETCKPEAIKLLLSRMRARA